MCGGGHMCCGDGSQPRAPAIRSHATPLSCPTLCLSCHDDQVAAQRESVMGQE